MTTSSPMRVAWIANTDGPVLATPLLVDDVLYAVDGIGFIYALTRATAPRDGVLAGSTPGSVRPGRTATRWWASRPPLAETCFS
jgi:hypothetical protein